MSEALTEREIEERLRGLAIHGEPKYIRVSELITDSRFQRPINTNRVRKIAAEFDPYAVGMLIVSERIDGTKIILDGQHRKQALVNMGWSDQLVPCFVYQNLDVEDEARIFRIMNENRVRPTPIDLFRTRMVERDPQAIDITRILHSAGMRVAHGKGAGYFKAISAAQRVYRDSGRDIFQEVITIIAKAWPSRDDPWAVSADMLLGLGSVLAEYEGEIDRERLALVLSRQVPSNLVAKAKALRSTFQGSMATCMAMAIVAAYNQGQRRRRIQEWQERPWRRNAMIRRSGDTSITPQ